MAKGAAIFNATSAVAYETGSLPSGETCTFGAWFYINSRNAGTNQTFFYLNAGVDYGLRLTTSNTMRVSGPGTDMSTVPPTGAWFYLAMVMQQGVGTHFYHYNASYVQQEDAFDAGWGSGGSVTEFIVGNALSSGGSQGWDNNGLYVSQARLWNSALSESDIEAEMASSTPVITANLLESFENDPSGDGWTTSGVTASTAYFPPNYPTLVKKLKLLAHSSAASASNIDGVVWAVQAGGIVGAEIGEFTGKSFEATLEGGKAVLKVPVADFGGGSLNVNDEVKVFVRNTTNFSDIWTGTIIEE